MLIPAALGGVIHEENVNDIKAKVIIEGANGPIDADADEILFERGVTVLPDILANAGGVTVSYFEWVQNRQYYSWDLNRVRQQLDAILSSAFEEVWQQAQTSEGQSANRSVHVGCQPREKINGVCRFLARSRGGVQVHDLQFETKYAVVFANSMKTLSVNA